MSAARTEKGCLATYSPKEVAVAFRHVNDARTALEVARSGQVATLGGLVRQIGENKVLSLIKLYLIDLDDVLGLKTPMTEKQVDVAASEIYEHYPYLTFADVNLVFRRIRCGEYGKLYDRLTLPQLMQIFSSYNDERCDEAARISRAEAEDHRWVDAPRISDKEEFIKRKAYEINMKRMSKNFLIDG